MSDDSAEMERLTMIKMNEFRRPRGSSAVRRKSTGNALGSSFYKQKTLLIELNDTPFAPGDVVKGQVVTNYLLPERVTGVVLKILGRGSVTWVEKVDVDKRKYHTQTTRTNFDEETYFSLEYDLIALEDNDEFVVIPTGAQVFPFEFELPRGIPSSFDEFGCTIEYLCIAIVEKIDKPKQRAIRSFMVTNHVCDLNLYPELSNPKEIKDHKTLKTFCCWKGGEIGFTFRVEKTGFLPGQNIDFTLELINMSTRKIQETQIELNREVRMFANRKQNFFVIPILNQTRAGILPGSEWEKQSGTLRLPHLSPLNLTGCTIMEVRYYLKFLIIIPGDSNLGGSIPIKIGSVPLRKESGMNDIAKFVDVVGTDEANQDLSPKIDEV